MFRAAKSTAICFLLGLSIVPSSGCAPANTPPEIVTLESRVRVVAPGDSVLIECTATDADEKDELTFEWAADRGTINGYANTIAWTAPVQEGLARITVTVGDGGEVTATESITVVVKRNTPPVVEGVTADLDWVRPGESIPIHCAAEDGDGDKLTYTWSTDCGEIAGEGDTVTWTAPGVETKCTISVVVDDGYDGRANGSLSLVSSIYEPLLVSSMTVAAVDEPAYLVARTDWYKVYWEDSYVIECFVPEPERIVSYEWSDGGPVAVFPVGAGNIAFEGAPSKIRWTAPKERVELDMTVTVRDEAGNTASKTIVLYVDTCTCAFSHGEDDESEEIESD